MPINLPNGANVEEIVLPNGSQAERVIGPNGSTLWERNAIPDSAINQYDAANLSSGGLSTFTDSEGDLDLAATGDPQVIEADQNGNSVVEYDSDDLHTASRSSNLTQPMTKAIVISRTHSGDNTFVSGGTNGSDDETNYIGVRSTGDDWAAGTAGGDDVLGGTTDQNYHILVTILDGTNTSLRVDGTEIATGDGGTEDDTDMYISGPNVIGNFRLGEAVVYDADLSSTGYLSDEETRLSDKWGIAI